MTYPILKLTQSGRSALLNMMEDDPTPWQNPLTDFSQLLDDAGIVDYQEPTGFQSPIRIELPYDPLIKLHQRHRLDHNASIFAEAVHQISPTAAQDPSIWEWITHFKLHDYSCQRWPTQRLKPQAHIMEHWFITNRNRNVYRDNTASRTYWIYTIASRIAQQSNTLTTHQILDVFAENPRIYHAITESQFARNPKSAAYILEAVTDPTRGEGINGDGMIALFRHLNLAFGKLIPETILPNPWRRIIDDALDTVMRQPQNVLDRWHLRGGRTYRVLSLGAGAQSSTMALMADRSEFGMTPPDVAIFADTGWEPAAVYQHLDWLKTEIKNFPIVTVTAGDIKENLLNGVMPDGSKFLGIPFFITKDRQSSAMMHRQCTTAYKLSPIHRQIRETLAVPYGRVVPKDVRVEMWIGISTDESQREKDSREEWVKKVYPLLDAKLSRAQLHAWFQANYPDRILPKSSCIGCPYHSDAIWAEMQRNHPSEFQQATAVDAALRANPNLTALTADSAAYIHSSLQPLDQIDFSKTTGYQDLMSQECEGVCEI